MYPPKAYQRISAVVRVGLLSVVVIGVLGVGACDKESRTPTILQSRPQSYVPDIPVPTGFERDERTSNYTSTAGHREVRDVYRGKEQPLAVRNFYVHYMSTGGWELLDDKLQNAVYLLNYRKDMERCEIRIERIPSGSFGQVTQIRVIVRPDA